MRHGRKLVSLGGNMSLPRGNRVPDDVQCVCRESSGRQICFDDMQF
jgi:hypothetical protein